MKFRSYLSICITAFFLQIGFAAENAGETIQVHVKGMSCLNCVNSIKREFKKEDKINDVFVSLPNKLVLLSEKKAQTLDDGAIRDHVKKAGYEVIGIERVQASFESLKEKFSTKKS